MAEMKNSDISQLEKPKEENNNEHRRSTTPEVDLSDLTTEQQIIVRAMLHEEREGFAADEDDIGCIQDLRMGIQLTDKQPVQKNYTAIPRPLYPKVKHYLEDLLNKNFIRKSKSPYSSVSFA